MIAMCAAIKSGKAGFGTYHVANSGATTWYDMAMAIFEALAARGERVPDRSFRSRPPSIRPRRRGRPIPCSTAAGCSVRSASRCGHGVRRWTNA